MNKQNILAIVRRILPTLIGIDCSRRRSLKRCQRHPRNERGLHRGLRTTSSGSGTRLPLLEPRP